MSSRRQAREYALQMLFQWDMTKDDPRQVEQLFWTSQRPEMPQRAWRRKPSLKPPEPPIDETVKAFASELFIGACNEATEIDGLIRRYAEHWRLERMAVVDRNILRMAIYEMTHRKETAAAVVINEALEIARRFSDEESVAFINGLLDKIRKEAEGEPPAPAAVAG